MRRAWKNFRIFVAECLLGLALDVMPTDTAGWSELAEFVVDYMKRRITEDSDQCQ